MTEGQDSPSHVFGALADPTRAQIIDWLDEGETATATKFAARLPISRQAVSRHLKTLEEAGLIVGTKHGREVRYGLQPRLLTDTAEGSGSGRIDGNTPYNASLNISGKTPDAIGPRLSDEPVRRAWSTPASR